MGLPLVVRPARLGGGLGHCAADRRFRIDGVTGPDEYSALCDNNVYTNLMARLNLRAAADACGRHPERAADLRVREEEVAAWRDAARRMYVPFDDRLGVHPQADGFTDHELWDFAATGTGQYPLLLHFSYFDLYRKQVVKQADLVLAMQLCGDAFSPADKASDFDYYERITVRDSSLSACSQAVMAAETGHLGLAYDYVGESCLIDLADLEHNTGDGLHMAALAGAWISLVEGLGGVRIEEDRLVARPRLPTTLRCLRFRIVYRGRCVEVRLDAEEARYRLLSGDELSIWHYDEPVDLKGSAEERRPIPAAPRLPPPPQPRRRDADDAWRRAGGWLQDLRAQIG